MYDSSWFFRYSGISYQNIWLVERKKKNYQQRKHQIKYIAEDESLTYNTHPNLQFIAPQDPLSTNRV